MNLEKFYFPVTEQDIALADNPMPDHWKISGYKAIVSPQDNAPDKVISVVKDSYKLIPNSELIEPFLDQVSNLHVRWKIDASHSFCEWNRMRLQVTFPDILVKDEESEIPLSLYLHNSYDQTEGVRLFWGAIRAVCSNGIVFGTLLGSFYSRHTQGFTFKNIHTQFDRATEKIGDVHDRITHLRNSPVNEPLIEDLQRTLGKRRLAEIIQTDRLPDASQWHLLNVITHHISNQVEKPKRGDLQLGVSKVFEL